MKIKFLLPSLLNIIDTDCEFPAKLSDIVQECVVGTEHRLVIVDYKFPSIFPSIFHKPKAAIVSFHYIKQDTYTNCTIMMAKKFFYNVNIVEREHKYACSLRNADADRRYTKLYSKVVGDVEIDMIGKKSGKRIVINNPCFKECIDYYKPSHLKIYVKLNTRLLNDPITSYPCKEYSYYDDITTRFEFDDVEAFVDTFRRIESKYMCIIPMIVGFFMDWVKVDAVREKMSAKKIEQQCLKHIYNPNSSFFVTQAVCNWNMNK